MVAVKEYINSTMDDVDHVVLASRRISYDTQDDFPCDLIELVRSSNLARVRAHIRLVVDQLRPDVVHLHSSWAGFVGRLSGIDPSAVVYTPHCYAFERRDVSPFMRAIIYTVEYALARRAGYVVGVSAREADLARRLYSRTDVRFVPNVAGLVGLEIDRMDNTHNILFTAAGRVARQKDPRWFAEFARAIRLKYADAQFLWLGGGDPEVEQELRSAGVEVTGWIPRKTLLQKLSGSTFYVHSAAWEGAPLAVLEAASLGVPVIGRDIPALRSMGLRQLRASPRELATLVTTLMEPGCVEDLRKEMADLTFSHSRQHQRAGLLAAYLGRTNQKEVVGFGQIPS